MIANNLLWLPFIKDIKNRGLLNTQPKIEGDKLQFMDDNSPFKSCCYFGGSNTNIVIEELQEYPTKEITITWWEKSINIHTTETTWSLHNNQLNVSISFLKGNYYSLNFIIKNIENQMYFSLGGNNSPYLNDGNWHFYALTSKLVNNAQNTIFTLFIDNEFAGEISSEYTYKYDNLKIGVAKLNSSYVYFNSSICDFRLYGSPMPQKNIEALSAHNLIGFMGTYVINDKLDYSTIYDNSGFNFTKFESKDKPNIFGNSILFDGTGQSMLVGNRLPYIDNGALSIWFIPYDGKKDFSILYIDTSSNMALMIEQNKCIHIDCNTDSHYGSDDTIKYDAINNVTILYNNKEAEALFVNGILQEIRKEEYTLDKEDKILCIGGGIRNKLFYNGEILKISVYGYNFRPEIFLRQYNSELNMLKNSYANGIKTNLVFNGEQFFHLELNESVSESLTIVLNFSVNNSVKNRILMGLTNSHFYVECDTSINKEISIYTDDTYILGNYIPYEMNTLKIKATPNEDSFQLNNNMWVASKTPTLWNDIVSKREKIIIGTNDKHENHFYGELEELKVYYDNVLGMNLIGAINMSLKYCGAYDIKNNNWYISDGEPFPA